jgi:carotenoid cleavage dioxygenase-like enzyme
MVDECLVVAGASPGGTTGQSFASCTSNAEYLDFLEAQAKTQVKILEVEVRAGQELLRLHKTQYEQERVEVRSFRALRTKDETCLTRCFHSWKKRSQRYVLAARRLNASALSCVRISESVGVSWHATLQMPPTSNGTAMLLQRSLGALLISRS